MAGTDPHDVSDDEVEHDDHVRDKVDGDNNVNDEV